MKAKLLTPHRIKVRQFKKQAGHKVRSHTHFSYSMLRYRNSNLLSSPLTSTTSSWPFGWCLRHRRDASGGFADSKLGNQRQESLSLVEEVLPKAILAMNFTTSHTTSEGHILASYFLLRQLSIFSMSKHQWSSTWATNSEQNGKSSPSPCMHMLWYTSKCTSRTISYWMIHWLTYEQFGWWVIPRWVIPVPPLQQSR